MRGNTRYDILVSARLMYFMLGHLRVRESTCSSFTRSLARFMATNVGVTRLHICIIESCDKPAPHNTRSVNLMHLVVRSAIVFARMGLYISASSDGCLARGGVFIIDRLIDVMWLVLSSFLRTWLNRVKSASDRSRVAKFLESRMRVAASPLLPPNSWSPRYVNLGGFRINQFSISISLWQYALHTQSGKSKEVVWALSMFIMTGFVIRRPLIVMFFHSFGVMVASLNR